MHQTKIDYYNSIANEYEEVINSSQVDAKFMYHVSNIFDNHNIDRGSLLDIGCGPGNLKMTLGDNFDYTGIDISKKMLELAKDKGYDVIESSIESILPKIKDNSFDYIVAISSLYFIEDLEFVLDHFDRIARKGWCASLDKITDKYIANKKFSDAIYNHINFSLSGLCEDVEFDAWKSTISSEVIRARLICKCF